MEIYVWSLLAIIAMVGSSLCIKQSIINNNKNWFYCALLLAMFLAYSYLNLYTDNNNVAITYTIINILAIVFFNIIGIICLGESYSNNKLIGIVFGLVSIFILTNK
jgi:multidrug transporter EmrE-like cation transporter